ncbi:Ribonucleoside-diphosphate reductase subunit alpha [Microcystis aeruginosa PCC 9432]|jgi:ribonucleoside-diphosphate reductase alpha chain|uniref:Ribonucleoside-diphosphate reductase n=1 Tax=Microcystis aeruginosa PCC 9432 TaxID=1160280 RepID=A0A830ZVS9_MICAE|nr:MULTISPECIES: ribonucleoside-diphosphate reductase subunit alpha [Microcystis]TRU01061.1 MAG: ribonucleoside-diphosphate reductase subunit alpha [Microcystis aeruginosa Ma_OC_LR_19540900_S633]MBE9244500.1 ribonucleoside-diphosphate reductase subunit alpha [Microcystis aeruginosa LEGE 00239]MCZ8241084.1 ribonucleoside-diphosphate reductase subunit alpha [Microcystis sp. LE19-131.1A]TYT70264.1 ribonucleoside-diphosphate reductase subunit alpha [Microcystis aeruginosa KLA2]CCH95656.1 Ribonucle
MQSKPLTTAVSIHKNNEVIPFRSTPLANMGSHGIRVIRRDGSTTSLNIGKIRDVVEWACEGKKVNSIALEAGLTTRLRDGITTREIQDNLINCALEMCSPEEPDWRYVAGRLHIWSLWKDTLVVRGYQYGNYEKTVKTQVKNRLYDERILIYSEAELKEAGSWINPDWDIDYDYAGALLITSRYLLKNELPQEALLTCSLLLATVEEPANRLPWAKKFYQAIAQRKISLATPILANLRTPKGSLTSCFILSIDDSLESIFSEITNAARISKNGGGVGVNVSRIRSTGSWVMGKANASGGIIPWIKLLNDTAIAVNQGGRRAGAVTIGVDIWHLDVPEFLEMQTENGDQRRKAYDVFPQLVITDEFMRRVITKAEWTLVDPYEVRTKLGIELAELWGEEFEEAYRLVEANLDKEVLLYKKINARDLFKSIMRSQVETGMPYIAFKDTINRANPNKHDGYIPGVNLCTESFSNVTPDKTAHCCNLVSLNLANIDKEEIESNCQIAVRILDNTIDITNPPFDNAKNHNDKYRTIGVGAMGLADWLAKRKLSYNNLSEISNLFEEIGYWCTYSSMELAKERGAYQAFLGSEWSQGKLIGAKPVEWFLTNAVQPQRWQQLATDIQRFGIRNSHITAIAPNTSSSLVQGCTASVLPVYSRFFYDKWAKGTVPIAPPFIEEAFWFYPENKNLEQQQVVKAIATMQEWIDTGISMELLFNLNEGVYFPAEPNRCLTAKDIFDTLIMAWELGCKAIYYVRTVQKDNFRESDDSCSSCAN